MGKIISIIGQKGGTGKSTLAQNLAVYFKNKKVDLIVIDTDVPQCTTADWADLRNDDEKEENKITVVIRTGNILHTLASLVDHYEMIIVDCGGQDSEAMRSALSLSDIAIIPTRPEDRDLESLVKIIPLVKEAEIFNRKLQALALMTQCPTLGNHFNRIEQAMKVCEDYQLNFLPQIIYKRNAYSDSGGGVSVFETANIKAQKEIIKVGEAIECLLIK